MRVAIIGTGNVGGSLGTRLAAAGCDVIFGARGDPPEGLLERAGARARAAAVADAVQAAEVVVLAVPGGAAKAVAAEHAARLDARVLIDATNPVSWDGGPVWSPPEEGSNAAAVAAAAPGARVVKAFNTFGAEFHADPSLGAGSVDVPFAADDVEAATVVAELAETAGFTPVNAGPLRNASVLENLAVLWIHLATVGGQGRNVAFKLLSR